MVLLALTLSLLAQEAEPPAEVPAADAPAAEAAVPAATGQGSGGSSSDPAVSALKRQADELARSAAKVKDLPVGDREKAIDEIRKKAQGFVGMPVVPPKEFALEQYFALTEPEQAFVIARAFFDTLTSGDAGRVVDFAGLPFFLEDKRVDRPDELRSTWAKHLRSKRTDLVTLYGVEVFTPADFEKKYGSPPARLKNWPWRQSGQYLAIANVSGRAAIIVLRSAGMTWQVIGYHD